MDVLLLRLDAPLMSFGTVMVDKHGVIQPYPTLSMLCGLLGNALGYHHRDFGLLQSLQERIRYAVRADRPGTRLRDYQTVALGQKHLLGELGWTTWGRIQARGGASKTDTTERLRDFWADASQTLALVLESPDMAPNIEDLAKALENPERPLFIGRKPCIPAEPILLGTVQADSLLHALSGAPLPMGEKPTGKRMAWWPTDPDSQGEEHMFTQPVTDARDWANQIHVGERWVATGEIELKQEGSDDG